MPQASPQHAGAVPAPLSHVSGVLGATSSALPWAMWVSLAGGTDGRGGGGVPAGRWQPVQAAQAGSHRCLMGFYSSGFHRELLSRKRGSAESPCIRR